MQARGKFLAPYVILSLMIAPADVSLAQGSDFESSLTIGTGAQLKIDQTQLDKLAKQKGFVTGSQSAYQFKRQFQGAGVELEKLDEAEILKLWNVLTAAQREQLAIRLRQNWVIPPNALPEVVIPLTAGPSPYNIPPSETSPPPNLTRNGMPVRIEQIQSLPVIISEADSCEAASVWARAWSDAGAIQSSQKAAYENSLDNWVKACLTRDVSDKPSLAGLDPSVIGQVVGVLSYGTTRFCTGMIQGGKVVTARHCFMKAGDAELGIVPKWNCPRVKEQLDYWCTTDAARNTLLFTRASDPTHPIPLSLTEAGITAPSDFDFPTDRIAVAVRSDNAVSLAGLPAVEWEVPKTNELVWLAGPVVSATQPDKYPGMYWSKFLAGKCRVVEVDGQCVRHYCQSLGGFSGSPMFTRTEVRNGQTVVKIAGMHLGGSESYKVCESNTVRLNIAQGKAP